MKTLNFIPDSEKFALRGELRILEWRHASILFCVIAIAITILVQLNLFLIRNFDRDLKQQLDIARQSQSLGQNDSLENSIRSYNSRAKIVENAIIARAPWSDRLSALTRIIPSGIELDQISLDRNDKSMTLRGRAQNRASYLNLKDSLEKTGWFNEIDLPITDLLNRDVIQFNVKVTPEPNFFTLN